MSSVPKEIKKVAPKKVYPVCLEVFPHYASISRPNMPIIHDHVEKAVVWLKDNGYRVEDIELIGEKPSNWDDIYPAPVPESKPVVEKIAEVLNPPVVAAPIPEPVAPIVAPADATAFIEPPKA